MINTRLYYHEYLQRDRIANEIRNNTFRDKVKSWLYPPPIWLFIKTLRRVEYYSNCRPLGPFGVLIGFVYKWMLRRRSMKLGFSIPINVFGPGLSIPHYGTIVVNSNARIGANCRLHVGVNIGASGGSIKAPCLGDNVYIGPGAIIFGDIQIADNVTIGANATVNRSCGQANVVLAGSPANIVKYDMPSWVDFNNINWK